jgi:hypothetical protein
MKIHTLIVPENKLKHVDDTNVNTVNHYGIDGIPVKFVAVEPDFAAVAVKVRDFINAQFANDDIVIRLVSLFEHNLLNNTTISANELAAVIKTHGSDRYNANIPGDRYGNIENRKIDFFAMDRDELNDDTFRYSFPTFYYYGIEKYGFPRLVDVVIVYDLNELNQIVHTYEGRGESKSDGFTFRNENDKARSILGVILLEAE